MERKKKKRKQKTEKTTYIKGNYGRKWVRMEIGKEMGEEGNSE